MDRLGRPAFDGDFSGESASGWQQATFGTPVAINANTTYVVSYHTNAGFYAADSGYFASAGWHNGPLYAPRDTEFGANGVFHYGAGRFPTDVVCKSELLGRRGVRSQCAALRARIRHPDGHHVADFGNGTVDAGTYVGDSPAAN